jgi:hypothetical protein
MNASNEWVVPNSTAATWNPPTTTGGSMTITPGYPLYPAPSFRSYGKLAEALAAAQGELHSAKKDTANPFFKSKYADLHSVWEACRAALSKHSLAVVQTLDVMGEKSQPVLMTMLIHKSGEFISSTYPIKPIKDDPQGVGSAITYARRYSLAAMVGVVADEDDDGEAATRTQKVATTTGTVETKRPKWAAEQSLEFGAIRARIIEATGDTGDNDVKQLTARMKYDQPDAVIDAMAKLLAVHQDIADRAKGGK